MPRIPTIWVDTSPLPTHEQFATWAAHGVASHFHPVRPGPFLTQGGFWNLGAAIVTKADVDPFIAVRNTAQIAERAHNHVQIVALFEGSVSFKTDEAVFDCRHPDLFLCDYRRPYRMTTSRTRMASVYMARSFLEEATGPVSLHGPLPRTTESAFLATILTAIDNVLPFAAATSAPFYARMLRELIAAALVDREALSADNGDRGLRHRIENVIMTAPPGTIDIAELCLSAAVSRSTLYRLFRRDGGVLNWDRTRRLRELYRAISDPADMRLLGEIGAAHGFYDSTGLARAFRTHFGMTAGQVRQRARLGTALSEDGETAFDSLRRLVNSLSN